jgi:formylglycine-generating enzyme required for sulfatase activity
MVVLPAGRFQMGDASHTGAASERPVHEVAIASAFAIGVAPITFEDYRCFAAAQGRAMPDDHGWGTGTRPIINVSWRDARDYASWLARETGLDYRLPSEAEWEYAARAGADTLYWWGDAIGVARANCDGCGSEWDNVQTSPVGSFAANDFGLVDMLGNVWEWVQDAWHQDYAGAPVDGSAWQGGNEHLRVARGGAWNYEPRHMRCASRVGYTLAHRSSNLGFRIALGL